LYDLCQSTSGGATKAFKSLLKIKFKSTRTDKKDESL